MKRLLFVLLMMTCSVSRAEWEFFAKTEEIEFYTDKSTIRKNGNISKIWSMANFHKIQTDESGNSYTSKKNLWAFDCKSEESVVISGLNFSEPMGGGKSFGSYTLQKTDWKWTPIVPESVMEGLWKIACSKR